MGDKSTTKSPRVFGTGEPTPFPSIDDIRYNKVEYSENTGNKLTQDGMLNGDSNQLVSLSTSVVRLNAPTSSSESSVGSPSGLPLATPMASAKQSSSKHSEGFYIVINHETISRARMLSSKRGKTKGRIKGIV